MNALPEQLSLNRTTFGKRLPSSSPSTESQSLVLARVLPALLIAVVLLTASPAVADRVIWEVDATDSYVRLTIPDQTVNVTNLGNVTVRMRDASSTTQWTDAGGRRTALAGELVTDYTDGRTITFLSGAHDLRALETTSLRPNPAGWDAVTTDYTDTSTAPAALGGRVRGTFLLTFDVAFLAFREVRFDITNTTGEAIVISSGTFASDATRCGIASALADVDGLELPLGLGQPIPDLLHAPLSLIPAQNADGGTILDLGGRNRKLTYTISIPELAIDLGGSQVAGSAAGQIVAYAELPPPAPPPTLLAWRVGNEIMLAWPTNAVGFVLEYATTLPATNWLAVSPPPVLSNGRYLATNTMTRDVVLYRLHKP